MELFVDTSALVKLYYPEADSDRVEAKLRAASRIYISEIAPVEFASALAKKARMGDIEGALLKLVWQSFSEDLQAANIEVISLLADDYLKAADLLLEHGSEDNLRTPDSLQLSAALKKPLSRFVSADSVLVNMAGKIGLLVELI